MGQRIAKGGCGSRAQVREVFFNDVFSRLHVTELGSDESRIPECLAQLLTLAPDTQNSLFVRLSVPGTKYLVFRSKFGNERTPRRRSSELPRSERFVLRALRFDRRTSYVVRTNSDQDGSLADHGFGQRVSNVVLLATSGQRYAG